MSYQELLSSIKQESPYLSVEQKLEIISVLALANKNEPLNNITMEENLALFEKFKGCIKGVKEIDTRKEYLEYLDERYGE